MAIKRRITAHKPVFFIGLLMGFVFGILIGILINFSWSMQGYVKESDIERFTETELFIGTGTKCFLIEDKITQKTYYISPEGKMQELQNDKDLREKEWKK